MDQEITNSSTTREERTPPRSYSIDSVTIWKAIAGLSVGLLILTAFFDVQIIPRFGGQDKTAARNVVQDASAKEESAPAALDASTAVPRSANSDALVAAVLPPSGVRLPIRWGNLGKQLVDSGTIDAAKFQDLYATRGGLGAEEQALLTGTVDEPIIINQKNSQYLLNLLWAFGLANKNVIIEEGPMQNPAYGGADRFSSTGGWTLAAGEAMDHYSAHAFVPLTAEQQALVEKVSKNIYRPCCGNPTYFPDCNHGMAMLGLLELMASQDVSEDEMYRTALAVNSYWFPDTYLTLATYFDGQGTSWEEIDPKLALSAQYSSSSGYREIRSQVEPPTVRSSGGGCGV